MRAREFDLGEASLNKLRAFQAAGPSCWPEQWEPLTALAVTLKPQQALCVGGCFAGLSFRRCRPEAARARFSEPIGRDAAGVGPAARKIATPCGGKTGDSAALARALGEEAGSLGLAATVFDIADGDPRRL